MATYAGYPGTDDHDLPKASDFKRDDYTGNAARDGYTCMGVRPRAAAPGNFLPKDKAAEYDANADMMAGFGGRGSYQRRRHRSPDLEKDDYGY